MTFVSIGIRFIANVEALNMVEAVGNVIRHRSVPYVYRRGSSYIIQWVPAISGEALAHAYQKYLADVGKAVGLPVCYWCSIGEFIKHYDLNFLDKTKDRVGYSDKELELVNKYKGLGKASLDQMKEIEKKIVETCIVEDIGGFLVTQGAVKRTSRVWFSYAIPTIDAVRTGAVALDNQFMVRHAPVAESLRPSNEVPAAQAPYYPQVASAVYGFTIAIDVDSIGVSSIGGEKIVSDEDRKRRVLAAFDALKQMLDSRIFGAKLSRFNPMMEYEVAVALIAKGLKMNVSAPILGLEAFIEETIKRALKAHLDTGAELKVVIWPQSNEVRDVVVDVKERLRKAMEEAKAQEAVPVIDKLCEVLDPATTTIRDFVNKVIKYTGY